jgi:YVTN family beta-propeller protein
MTMAHAGHRAARRLPRYLAIPAGFGALALTLAATTPASAAVPATRSLTPIATIAVGQNPTGIAVDQATGTAYVSCTGPSPDVYAIDEATNTVTATIPVGTYPAAVAVNSDTGTIYTANKTAGTVSVIDGATNTVTATIPVPGAYLVATDTNNNTVFVAGSGGLSTIDGATNTVTRTVSVGGPRAMAVNSATKRVYVGYDYGRGGLVDVLQAGTSKVLASIDTSFAVRAIVADSRNNMIYVADGTYGRHRLEGISGATNQRVKYMRVSDHQWTGTTGVGLAVDESTDTILQISGKTFHRATITSATVNALPVAADSHTSTVYVARYGSPNVHAYHSSVS